MEVEVNEEIVTHILINRKQIETHLNEHMKTLNDIEQSLEKEVYSLVTLSGTRIKESVQHTHSIQDLSDVALTIEKERSHQRQVIQMEKDSISAQKVLIDRIFICFRALPWKEADLLKKLYLERQKWEALEMNNSQISQLRHQALKRICDWTNSSMTDAEIIKAGSQLLYVSNTKRKRKKKKKEVEGQLSFFLE